MATTHYLCTSAGEGSIPNQPTTGGAEQGRGQRGSTGPPVEPSTTPENGRLAKAKFGPAAGAWQAHRTHTVARALLHDQMDAGASPACRGGAWTIGRRGGSLAVT
jgi:hypothetical protein